MELLIGSKSPEDAIPWSSGAQSADADLSGEMLGRGYFSELGKVRRKPARADAESSLSKSCTDKLTMKQNTSLLSFPIDLLVEKTENTFLKSLIVYSDHFSETGYNRAFSKNGRIISTTSTKARHFEIGVLPESCSRFSFEKLCKPTAPIKASNLSTLWISGQGVRGDATIEVLINGVKQGFKQFDERAAKESTVCRKQMWRAGREVVEDLMANSQTSDYTVKRIAEALSCATYAAAKASDLRTSRRAEKSLAIETLGSWPTNSGDEDWGFLKS